MSEKIPRLRLTKDEFKLISKIRSGKTDVKEVEVSEFGLSELAEKIRKHSLKLESKGKTPSLEEIANTFQSSPAQVKKAIKELSAGGFNAEVIGNSVMMSRLIPKRPDLVIPKTKDQVYRFGAAGDMHLGSKYERLDALHRMYDIFEEQGVKDVFNTGNWIDGEARFNKHDLHTHGMDNQIEYMLEYFPYRDSINTHLIGGDDHEGWYTQREGIDIGLYLEMKARAAGREDLHYLGYMEQDIIFPAKNGSTRMRVIHPGGGSSYAISYTMQKLVESLQEGEKPHIILAGHYHKQGYNQIRGVHAIQTGCFQDQTPFMRKKKLSAAVGGWIIEVHTDENGAVSRFIPEWIPFYNREYYSLRKSWSYQAGNAKGAPQFKEFTLNPIKSHVKRKKSKSLKRAA